MPADRRKQRAAPRPQVAPVRETPVPIAWSAALALAFLALGLALAPNLSASGDAGELTLVLVKGGVAHPTGYPIFVELGHAFVAALRAVGVGYAYAANAWGVVGATVALLLLHRLALRLLPYGRRETRGVRFALAALPVVALGLHPAWLSENLTIEVYGWHVAWLCGLLLLFVRTVTELDAPMSPRAFVLRMLAWGALAGLGGAHHATAIFPVLACTLGLAIAIARAMRLRAWVPLAWIGAALVPLASDLVMLARAQHPGGAAVWPALEPTMHGLWEHVTAGVYHGFVGHWNPDSADAATLDHQVAPFLWPGLAILAAWLLMARHATDRIVRAALLASAVLFVGFAYTYGVPDPVSYFLAPLAIALLALLWPAQALLARSRVALAATAVVLLALLGAWGVRAAFARRRDVAHDDGWMRSMWAAVPENTGIFIWASDDLNQLRLYQAFEGQKPHVELIDTAMLVKDQPAHEFQLRHGFDPLADTGPEHANEDIDPKYFTDAHTLLPDRLLARVNETIAEHARVPVLLFNGDQMKLRRLR
jgi:hypothetical protein